MTGLFEAIEIEINHGCNKTCSYCPNSVAERIEKGHMSVETYTLLLAQLNDLEFKGRISFHFYNEPMLSPNLDLFSKMAKDALKGISIELYTNGIFLTLDRFCQLEEAGVDLFIVTQHEDTENYPFLDTLKVLSEPQKKKVQFKNFKDIKLTNRGGVLPHIQSPHNTTLLPCFIPSKMVTVTVEGNVVPCFEDFYQKNQMGNIHEKSIRAIWSSEKYEEFRKNLKKGMRHQFEACKSCNRTEVL
jgi:radical SAM protein with 4Fe4S-binding SPASM domain